MKIQYGLAKYPHLNPHEIIKGLQSGGAIICHNVQWCNGRNKAKEFYFIIYLFYYFIRCVQLMHCVAQEILKFDLAIFIYIKTISSRISE